MGRIISPYGFAAPTENIMAFAKEATVFTNSFCVAPTCSPSRAGLLTGTYPHQNGMLGLAHRGFGLNDYSKHLCQFLAINGYTTVLSGIQHEAGFYLENGGSETVGYQYNLTTDSSCFEKENLHIWDHLNAQSAVQWIKQYDNQKPFFLSYGMNSTHRPFPIEIDDEIDEKYLKPVEPILNNADTRHDHAQLLTSLKNADEGFSMIINELKEKGIYENTIILFTTDHGLPLPFHKCYLNDFGIAVALIMRIPGATSNGQVIDSMVSHIDVFPTLCDLLAIEKPDYLEGKSFSKVFHGEECADNIIFAEINFHTSYEPSRCARTQRYKYIRYYDDEYLKTNASNIDVSLTRDFYIDNGWLDLVKDKEGLYDLLYDPSEKNNLINDPQMIEVSKMLREALLDFQIKTNDPLLKGPLEIKKSYKVNKRECINPSSKNQDDYDEKGMY
jgi:arylsulfatase A-like enzyme